MAHVLFLIHGGGYLRMVCQAVRLGKLDHACPVQVVQVPNSCACDCGDLAENIVSRSANFDIL